MSVALIAPTYKNPDYARLWLEGAIKGKQLDDSQIILVIDGHRELYNDILKRWAGAAKFLINSVSRGMAHGQNIGVGFCDCDRVIITNDDNVPCIGWDSQAQLVDLPSGHVHVIDQFEPDGGTSIFNYRQKDLGREAVGFSVDDFQAFELDNRIDREEDGNGFCYPFLMWKLDYLRVGGFDVAFTSPFVVDDDFWLKCQLNGFTSTHTRRFSFYHFGSRATKLRPDAEAEMFRQSERVAFDEFFRKWGFYPKRKSHGKDHSIVAQPVQTPKEYIREAINR